jgi:hypothetical protein
VRLATSLFIPRKKYCFPNICNSILSTWKNNKRSIIHIFHSEHSHLYGVHIIDLYQLEVPFLHDESINIFSSFSHHLIQLLLDLKVVFICHTYHLIPHQCYNSFLEIMQSLDFIPILIIRNKFLNSKNLLNYFHVIFISLVFQTCL